MLEWFPPHSVDPEESDICFVKIENMCFWQGLGFPKWLQKSTKISDILNCNIKTSAEQRQFILPNNFNYDFYMNVSLFPNKITVTCSFNSKHFVWFTGCCLPKLEEASSKLSLLWLYFNGHQSCGLFVFKFRNTTLSYLIWNIPSVGRYFKITFTFIITVETA